MKIQHTPMTITEAVRAMDAQLDELDDQEAEVRRIGATYLLRDIEAIRARVIANMDALAVYLESLPN